MHTHIHTYRRTYIHTYVKCARLKCPWPKCPNSVTMNAFPRFESINKNGASNVPVEIIFYLTHAAILSEFLSFS